MKMKLQFLTVCIMLCAKVSAQTPPVIQWQKSLGGSNEDNARSIIQSTDGGLITIGSTRSIDGDFTNNQGSDDIFVVKQNSSGVVEWQKTYGGTGNDQGYSVISTPGGGYIIAGSTSSSDGDITINKGKSDCWIIKINSSGVIEWQKTYGGTEDDAASSIINTGDGGYIIAGYTYSNNGDLSFSQGADDSWIIKINSLGVIEWQKTYGGTNNDSAHSLIQTTDGGYVVVGNTYSANGDITSNHGDFDCWVLKLSSTGVIEWQKTYGGNDGDFGISIIQSADGGYLIAGYTKSGDVVYNHGVQDAWVFKIKKSGELQWQKTYGGARVEYMNAFIKTSDGNYIIGGETLSSDSTFSTNHGAFDYYLTKIDTSGSVIWQGMYGGSNDEQIFSVTQMSDGEYALAGYSYSDDKDVKLNKGKSDIWIVKLSKETLGINDVGNLYRTTIYPNPFTDKLHININGMQNRSCIIEIFNALGQKVLQQQGVLAGFDVETSDLVVGVYTYSITTIDGVISEGKLIK